MTGWRTEPGFHELGLQIKTAPKPNEISYQLFESNWLKNFFPEFFNFRFLPFL